ncbi:hypothetical protein GIB67_014643 [Kingdonia uniflora]|uniref:RING-type domain-containing protein n=1 Tax=Kingdonia uniflora TaxID=39325 RepID=A0A7J7NVE0_9MAGN|nr:hypothetical protein GIB67_014643 [Kingdonia uniflora]
MLLCEVRQHDSKALEIPPTHWRDVLRDYVFTNMLTVTLTGIGVSSGTILSPYIDVATRCQRFVDGMGCGGGKAKREVAASVSAVVALPSVEVSSGECVICREQMKEGRDVCELPCQHLFHWICVLPWLKKRNTCPCCRFQLPTDDVLGEIERLWGVLVKKAFEAKFVDLSWDALTLASDMLSLASQFLEFRFEYIDRLCTFEAHVLAAKSAHFPSVACGGGGGGDYSSLVELGRAIHAHSIAFGIPRGVETARILFERMEQRTLQHGMRGDIAAGKELFDKMLEKDEQSWNIMVCGYTQIGKFRELFNVMPVKTLPTWNAMISGYTRASRPAEALSLFRKMQIVGVKPDINTLVTVLPACAQLERFDTSIAVYNAIIDVYAKCGCVNKALDVFKRMQERNVVSYNTIISGLAIHGRGHEAIEIFTEMERTRGIKPEDITYVGLLNAFAHSGLVERGSIYFQNMQKDHGIQPKIEHYGCMVDVLGRAG